MGGDIGERLLSFTAHALLVVALPLTDEIGFVLGALLILQHVCLFRRVGSPRHDWLAPSEPQFPISSLQHREMVIDRRGLSKGD